MLGKIYNQLGTEVGSYHGIDDGAAAAACLLLMR